MSLASVGSLVDAIQQHRLLEPGQLDQLAGIQAGMSDPRALAKLLIERNWLTPFQINQVLSGRGQDLLLGSYVLIQRLGEGGTGQVFKARHQRMRRVVALKVIRRELLSEEEVVARFYREIRVASQVAHPHVVHAYDAGPVGNTHFLAMEYVKGIDLCLLVKEMGPLPVEQAGDYVRQAAVGLQHIAETGLIHRDIKPSNLLVTPDPRPQANMPSSARTADGECEGGLAIDPALYPWGLLKILDLGLARFEKRLHGELTGTFTPVGGLMMGTPDYMAPEQALDFHETDIRSDIYSLGCTFCYLLTGQPPFPGGTLAQKLLWHQQSPPPSLANARSDVCPAVQAVLARMLAKKPDDRYQTPGELAAELATALRGEPSAAIVNAEAAVGHPPLPAEEIYSHSGVLASSANPPTVSLLPLAPLCGSSGVEFAVSAIPLASAAEPSAVMPHPAPRTEQLPTLTPPRHKWRRNVILVAGLGVVLVVGLASIPFVFTSSKPVGKESGKESGKAVSPTLPDRSSENIPASERFAWQPRELVAVLGEHRLRHWGTATGVAFSPKGNEIVSVGSDQIIRVWDAVTGQERAAYPSLKSWIPPVAIGGGGKQVLSGSVDNSIRLWDAPTGKEVMTFKGHGNRVIAVAMSLDGKIIASASTDGTVRVWDMATGVERHSTKREQVLGLTSPLSILADGKTVMFTGTGTTIRLWDTSTNTERVLPTGQKGFILAVVASADGQTIVAFGQDRTIRVLDTTTGKERTAFQGSGMMAAISPDGHLLAVPGTDGTIKLYNVAQAVREVGAIKAHLGAVTGIAFAPGGRTLASSSNDGTVRVWDVETLQEAIPLQGHPTQVRHVAFSPDSRTIATTSGDRSVRIWDAASGREKTLARIPVEAINDHVTIAVLFPPSAPPTLITAHNDGKLRFWDPVAGKENRAAMLIPGATNLQAIACSPNGKSIAAAVQDGSIKIVDLASGREIVGIAGHRIRVSHLAFTPDSLRVLSVGSDGIVRLWEAATGNPVSAFPAPGAMTLAMCPQGKFIAWTTNGEHAVHLWDLENQKELALLGGHTNRVTALAFSPTAPILISTGSDGRVIVWDLETKRSSQEWQMPGPVSTVAVAPDGQHIVTGNSNGTAFVIRLNPPTPKSPVR